MLENRVFGPPGTGKTTFLSRQVAIEAERHGAESILVASFTRAAAAEIRGRELPIPDQHVGTLHSLCYRSMGCPPLAETRKGFREWNRWIQEQVSAGKHPRTALQFSVEDGGRDRDPDDPYEDKHEAEAGEEVKGGAVLDALNFCRARLLRPGTFDWDQTCNRLGVAPPLVDGFNQLWSEFKVEAGVVDFADMIDHGRAAGPPDDARVLLFDEAQDFSAAELAVVRRWGERAEVVFLAGDDDQAIYGFRGATPDAFLDPPVPPEQKRVLGQSHRLSREVLRVSQEWISLLSRREPKAFLPRDADGGVEALSVNYRARVEEIAALAEEEASAGKTVMILGLCSYMLGCAGGVIGELMSRGAPFHNPYRVKRGDWNPLRGARRLRAFLAPAAGDGRQLWTWGDLGAWVEVVDWKRSGLRHGAKKAVATMAQDPERAEAPVGLDDFRALFSTRERAEPWLRMDPEVLAALTVNERQERSLRYPIQVLHAHGAAALSATPRITVGTVHSVKGGEADVVVLLSDLSFAAREEVDNEDDGEDACRRVFYVGMTRARERLYVTRPYVRDLSMGLDRFVEE